MYDEGPELTYFLIDQSSLAMKDLSHVTVGH